MKTYFNALLFAVPALIFWLAVQAKCIPVLVAVVDGHEVGFGIGAPLWSYCMLLVEYGLPVLLGLGVLLGLMELGYRGWAPYRRAVVGGLVWTLNFAIVSGLAALVTVVAIAIPGRMQ